MPMCEVLDLQGFAVVGYFYLMLGKVLASRLITGLLRHEKTHKFLGMLNLLQINEDYYVPAIPNLASVVLALDDVLILRPSDYAILAILNQSEVFRSSESFIVRPSAGSARIVLASFPI